jgi:hypothetical protein
MREYIAIGFQAVAIDENGIEYDASFYVGFPTSYYTQQQVNSFIQNEINKFYQTHKNGKILKQAKRVFIL